MAHPLPALFRLSALCALLLSASTARCVIVYGPNGDGASNTTVPGDDPGWAYVAAVNPADPASAVYLGNYGGGYWLLTANHVNLGSTVTLGGITYNIVGGSADQIGSADLKVFRIDADPGLPTLTLATTAPPMGDPVVMIGNGRRKATINEVGAPDIYTQTWDINEVNNPDTWASPGTEAAGYAWGSTSVVRWGTNRVTAINVNAGGTLSTATTFDDTLNVHEAQAARGDSGGAVFYKNGSVWELSAIMFSVGANTGSSLLGGFDGQPADTAIYQYPTDPDAGSTTFAAQVSTYRTAILGAVPEPSTAMLASLAALALSLRRPSRAACRSR